MSFFRRKNKITYKELPQSDSEDEPLVEPAITKFCEDLQRFPEFININEIIEADQNNFAAYISYKLTVKNVELVNGSVWMDFHIIVPKNLTKPYIIIPAEIESRFAPKNTVVAKKVWDWIRLGKYVRPDLSGLLPIDELHELSIYIHILRIEQQLGDIID